MRYPTYARFSNPVGAGSLWFDNLVTADGVPVAYDPQARAFIPMPPFCANHEVIGCNWIAPKQGEFCRACAMTALAPDPSISDAIPNWAQTEAAKRWVIDNLAAGTGFARKTPARRRCFICWRKATPRCPWGMWAAW